MRRQFAVEGTEATPAAVVTAVRAEHAVLGDTTVLRLAGRVHDELVGAGPLAPLLAESAVTDVLVNGTEVWVDRGAGLVRAPIGVGSADDVRRLAQRLAAACGRRLDDGQPFADARLPDGTRLHAVLPPIATSGPYLSLRTFRQRPFTLDDLVADGTVADGPAEVLAAIVAARLAYLVTGGTGSGKTTLLGTLLGLVPATERIVLVEDAAELRPTHPHVVTLQARTANVEGAGAVGLTDLVRQALRMRPDRLIIGECRGAEIVDLLGALNTGHEGGAGTLHANAPADVPARLEALGLLGGLPRAALHAQVLAALQVIVQVRRTPTGRALESISVLLPHGRDRLATVVPAWHRATGPGPAAESLSHLLTSRGVPSPPLLTPPLTVTPPPAPATTPAPTPPPPSASRPSAPAPPSLPTPASSRPPVPAPPSLPAPASSRPLVPAPLPLPMPGPSRPLAPLLSRPVPPPPGSPGSLPSRYLSSGPEPSAPASRDGRTRSAPSWAATSIPATPPAVSGARGLTESSSDERGRRGRPWADLADLADLVEPSPEPFERRLPGSGRLAAPPEPVERRGPGSGRLAGQWVDRPVQARRPGLEVLAGGTRPAGVTGASSPGVAVMPS